MNNDDSLRSRLSFKPPTREQIMAYAARRRLELSTDDIDDTVAQVGALVHVLDRVDELPAPRVSAQYSHRSPGRPPATGEDPHNAIACFCEIKGSDFGPLAGKCVGIKENIAVAGLSTSDDTRSELQPVSTEDAVVVERLLEAGATIVAKTRINSGRNDSSVVTRNPVNPRFSAGASSGGSAAAVASGIVDAALGVDQGGSIRIPAAFCGIVGMKATHGLVPSYGLIYWDHTLDHIGPMTSTVAENAALLEVIAGGDWRDPQWVRADPSSREYATAAHMGIEGLRIGVVSDALEPAGCTEGTLEAFKCAKDTLSNLGARVMPVSVPLWLDAPAIWLLTLTFGLTTMADSFGQGYGHLGRVDVNRLAATADHHRHGNRDFPLLGQVFPLLFEYVRDIRLGLTFGRAQNLRLELRHQIDKLFEQFDLLITPTNPTGPPELTQVGLTSSDYLTQIGNPTSSHFLTRLATGLPNTSVNLTGHPALTVPSGPGDHELPTGLQIIGPRFGEYTMYRAGFAFEATSH